MYVFTLMVLHLNSICVLNKGNEPLSIVLNTKAVVCQLILSYLFSIKQHKIVSSVMYIHTFAVVLTIISYRK